MSGYFFLPFIVTIFVTTFMIPVATAQKRWGESIRWGGAIFSAIAVMPIWSLMKMSPNSAVFCMLLVACPVMFTLTMAFLFKKAVGTSSALSGKEVLLLATNGASMGFLFGIFVLLSHILVC